MNKNILIAFIFMAVQLLADDKSVIGGMKDFDYVNQSTNIVTILVPYFAKTNNATRLMPIALEPGDAYFRGSIAKRQNGSLHKKYGLMPNLSAPAMERVPVWPEYGNYHECSMRRHFVNEVLNKRNTKYYDDYVWSSQFNQKSTIGAFSNCIRQINDELKKAKDDPERLKRDTYQDLIFRRNYLSIVTNTPVNAMESMYDLDADSDGDGLSNREEFELNTSALVRDRIVLAPYLMEVPFVNHGTTTNFFTIRNLSDEDWNCGLGFRNKYEHFPWKPRIVSVDGTELQPYSTIGDVVLYCRLLVKANSSVKLALLCDAENLPADFGGTCDIGVKLFSKNFEMYLPGIKVNVFIRPGKIPEVIAPSTEIPESGSHFVYNGSATNVVFTWADNSCKPNKKRLSSSKLFDLIRESPELYSRKKYDPQSCIGKSYCLYVYKLDESLRLPKEFSLYKPENFADVCNGGFDTGIYAWRVSKFDLMRYPVASDWNWFSVGEEIRPDMAVATDDKTTDPSQPSK